MKQAEQGMYASGQRAIQSYLKVGNLGKSQEKRESWRRLGIMTNNKSKREKCEMNLLHPINV